MNRFLFTLLCFFGWALAIELVLILAYHLLIDGRFSLAMADIPRTTAVLLLFVALFASAVITRILVRRRRVRQGR
ncbi:hypothetical protein [Sphingosinithalassobacter sp. LHW66-3]|uniref:hypothetical protein n=1 Tax=Sphingosinithalassobacter sp. LHW66-3 TaxID=3424718 RepID=UPI003D6B0E3A